MIKQFVPSVFCLKCPGCCRFSQQESIWQPCLLDSEANLKLHLTPSNKELFLCCFLKLPENKCKIYRKRPFDCQVYPFLFHLKEERFYLAVDLNCPFAKENFKTPSFQEYTQYLIELFNRPDYRKILKDNPQIFQPYTELEVVDLVELKI